ncbi:MAG: ORF6N domain-containing protein, partial [Candidatus Marinimicrobia bacterium]|nr:ORF6N domain-containing protein [Candidatus Neomarinimicrobiota bacterium]
MKNEISTIDNKQIKNKIFTIRGVQVMLDSDLATLYGVQTRILNQAVKRNIERFPEIFRFQLFEKEKQEVITNCDNLKKLKFSPTLPYVFTEQGVAMLSAVLKS